MTPVLLIVFFLFSSPLHAQTSRVVLEPAVTGLSTPVYFTSAKDGTNRRFVIEQAGRIRVLQPGSSSFTTFLDITSRVLFNGERGLLGLAFHPQFSADHRFFVNYTRQPDGATVIAEFRVSATNPNIADPAQTVLLTVPQPFENHNGGMIEFGPDGQLYIGMGDGGSGNDPGNRAQNLQQLLGKLLLLDVDRPQGAPAIFAYGFRNPWRFSFDRLTGQLYAGDVGQDAREEVDIVTSGGNYGWRVWEGTRCTNLGPAPCSTPGFIPPIIDYQNTGRTAAEQDELGAVAAAIGNVGKKHLGAGNGSGLIRRSGRGDQEIPAFICAAADAGHGEGSRGRQGQYALKWHRQRGECLNLIKKQGPLPIRRHVDGRRPARQQQCHGYGRPRRIGDRKTRPDRSGQFGVKLEPGRVGDRNRPGLRDRHAA